MLEGWSLPYTHGREGGCNSAALRWCHGQCLPVMVLQWSAMPGGMEQPSSLCPRHPHPAQRKKYVHCQFWQAIRSHLVTLMNQIKSFVDWQMSKRSQPFKEHHAFCFLSVMNENQHPKLSDLLKAHENAFESPEIRSTKDALRWLRWAGCCCLQWRWSRDSQRTEQLASLSIMNYL